MFDSQTNQFLGADASGAQAQPMSAPVTSWNQDEATGFDPSPGDPARGQAGETPAFGSATPDWKTTMKNNYTASLADGDPLDGVAEAKLVQMRANNSATESGGAGAGNASVATDAGGGPGQKWNRDAAIQHLEKYAGIQSQHNCAGFVGRAIEAGGIRLNRALNSAGKSACGYGPILEDTGFKPVPEGTPPQAGDVVIFPKSPGYPDGHAAMYSGEQWISDF
ncbi:MAG: hypothetical protein AB7U63_16270 [Porticoccaceae bacterium]